MSLKMMFLIWVSGFVLRKMKRADTMPRAAKDLRDARQAATNAANRIIAISLNNERDSRANPIWLPCNFDEENSSQFSVLVVHLQSEFMRNLEAIWFYCLDSNFIGFDLMKLFLSVLINCIIFQWRHPFSPEKVEGWNLKRLRSFKWNVRLR